MNFKGQKKPLKTCTNLNVEIFEGSHNIIEKAFVILTSDMNKGVSWA